MNFDIFLLAIIPWNFIHLDSYNLDHVLVTKGDILLAKPKMVKLLAPICVTRSIAVGKIIDETNNVCRMARSVIELV